MDEIGVTAAVLPELAELRGIDQSRFHHLDVYEHTRAVLAEMVALEEDPAPAFGAQAEAVRELLAEPLADELTRGGALRFAAAAARHREAADAGGDSRGAGHVHASRRGGGAARVVDPEAAARELAAASSTSPR